VGDPAGTGYGMIRLGTSTFGRTSRNTAALDLDGTTVLINNGTPATSNILFAMMDGSNSIRFALPKSAIGNGTYNPRSMIIAGPAPVDDTCVTVGYWQGQGIFDNLSMDTSGSGADLGVQNDLEVEGTIYTDTIAESTAAAGVTIDGLLVKDGGITASIVGITGTTAEFNTALTDGTFATGGGTATGTNTGDVTKAGAGTYVSLAAQVLTVDAITEGDLSLSDVTTADVSISAHGFVPKGTNVGDFLRDDGTWQTIPGGGDALTSGTLGQFSATTSAQLAGVISDETGSGLLVFATSPTLTTPVLGTPTSGALTNCTAYPGDSSLVTTGALNSGSITSGFGNINIGASTFDTTGAVSTGALTVGGDINMNGSDLTDVHEIALDGLPDTDHTANGPTTSTFNAGATVAIGDLMYLDSTPDWNLTDAGAEATAGGVMLAIALEAGTATHPVKVALSGSFVRDDTWAWTIGGELYVSTTAGDLTQTAPSATGDIVRVVGYAVSAAVIYFLPAPTWVEIA